MAEWVANALFGKPKSPPPTASEQGDAFRTKLNQTERTMDALGVKIQREIMELKRQALKARNEGKTDVARSILRKIAPRQNQLSLLGNYSANNIVIQSNVENTQLAIENAKLMQESTQYTRSLMQEMGGVDDVQDIMDDVKDIMAESQEIVEAVSKPLDTGDLFPELDDAALDAAMDELDDELTLETVSALAETIVPVRTTTTMVDVAIPSPSPPPRSRYTKQLAQLGD